MWPHIRRFSIFHLWDFFLASPSSSVVTVVTVLTVVTIVTLVTVVTVVKVVTVVTVGTVVTTKMHSHYLFFVIKSVTKLKN